MSSTIKARNVSQTVMLHRLRDVDARPRRAAEEEERQPVAHGGDLAAARRLFPDAPQPFIDLSTGINPHPYPIGALPPEAFTRLPEPGEIERLAGVAAAAYGVPPAARVVLAPGSQILIPLAAALVEPGRAAVLGPTYAEHARAATLLGHRVEEVGDPAGLAGVDLAVVVNPNNPDGRVLSREALLAIADRLRPGGLLVVDEAFVDVVPAQSLARDAGRRDLVVLRSFGKFFGLAGLRLGFALAAPQHGERLAAALGPWPVAGPTIAIGTAALGDRAWAHATRNALAQSGDRLERLLIGAGLDVVGGTSLFRLARTPAAAALYRHLGTAGVLVRAFTDHPAWLRFGLPAGEPALERLAAALAAFASQ
jgi:cobalamin biosynthesis protein CobC